MTVHSKIQPPCHLPCHPELVSGSPDPASVEILKQVQDDRRCVTRLAFSCPFVNPGSCLVQQISCDKRHNIPVCSLCKIPPCTYLKSLTPKPIISYVIMPQETEIRPVYTIRVASRLTGVSPGTIREYERQGLLRTHRDSQNNHRLFTQAEINWITHIWHLIHKEGLNYEGIRRLLLSTPCWKVLKCQAEYRNICEVYLDTMSTCWSLEKLPACCAVNDRKCQTCKVYESARDNPYLVPAVFFGPDGKR